MKISLVLSLFAVCVPIAAHAQSDVSPDALPLAPKSVATSDAFVWRFAPPVGSRWTLRSFVRSTTTDEMSVSQDNTPNKKPTTKRTSIIKTTIDYDVLSRDALGATMIRLTIRDVAQDQSSTFDGKTTQLAVPKTSDTKFINGATLTIKQAPDGKIWGIVGMRAFVRRLLKMDGRLDTKRSNEILEATVAGTQEEIVKQLNVITGVLPISPVRVGESWNYTGSLPVPSPYTLEVAGTRTLRKLDSGFAVVVDNAQIRSGQQNLPLTTEMGNIRADPSRLKVTVDSTSRVQRSSGLPLETTLTQSVKGSYSTQSANGVREVPVDNTIFTRIVLEPRS